MAIIEVVFVAPVHILIAPLELEESVHQSNMIPLLTDKLRLRVQCLIQLLAGTHEDIWHVQTCHDCQDLVDTVVFWRGQQHFRQLRLKREFSHSLTQSCQLSFVVKSTQVV